MKTVQDYRMLSNDEELYIPIGSQFLYAWCSPQSNSVYLYFLVDSEKKKKENRMFRIYSTDETISNGVTIYKCSFQDKDGRHKHLFEKY